MKVRLIPWGLKFAGRTWVAYFRICRTLDGRWAYRGVTLNRFGWRSRPHYAWLNERNTRRRMRLTRVWCPYLLLFVGESLVDTYFRERPDENPET